MIPRSASTPESAGRSLAGFLAELEPPVRSHIEGLGTSVVAAEAVTEQDSARPASGSGSATDPPVRLWLQDGRALKLKRARPGRPARAAAALEALDLDAFPPVLAHGERTLLTRWIDGSVLPAHPAAEHGDLVCRCGALQATLHSAPAPRVAGHGRAVADWIEWLERVGAELVGAGVLGPRDADLLDRARAAAPVAGGRSWIHRDFCADNIILDLDGELRVIDNESLEPGVPEYDLARTWTRWPMDPPLWARYLEGYGQRPARSRFEDGALFWLATATLGSVYYRWRCRGGLERALHRWSEVESAALGTGRPSARDGSGVRVHPGETTEERAFVRSGLRVRVRAPRPDMDWLAGFIEPWFDGAPAAEGGRTDPRGVRAEARVELIRGGRYDAIRTALAHGAPFHPRCFTRDGGDLALPAAPALDLTPGPDAPDGLALHDAQFGCGIVLDGPAVPVGGRPRGRAILYAAPGNVRARLTLLRVVREYLHQHLRAAGVAVLHGAAIERAGRVLVLAGPRAVGKTTTLCRLLVDPDPAVGPARFVSNDRVEVAGDGGGLLARGIPTIVSLRPGTRAVVRTLADGLAAGFLPPEHAGPRAALRALRPDRPAHVAPAELCRLLGCEPARGGTLGVIALLERDGAGPPDTAVRLTAPEAAARLEACRLGAGSDGGRAELLVPDPAPGATPGDAPDLDELAARVPVVRLRLARWEGGPPGVRKLRAALDGAAR